MKTKRFQLSKKVYLVFFLLLFSIVLCCCSWGRYHVAFGDVLCALSNYLFGSRFDIGQKEYISVILMRLPRILMSVMVGASLSISGAVYQSVFGNKLVSPDLLGVTGGCCVGASIAILCGASGVTIVASSFSIGILAVSLALMLPILMHNSSNLSLVLSGIIVSAVFNSALGLIKYTVDSLEKLEAITFWIMGSLSSVTMQEVANALPFFISAMAALLLLRFQINIISLGENEAVLLGIKYHVIRIIVIVCATILTASSTAICGTVSWIGLIVPHISRLIVGTNNRELLPFSAMLGALILPVIDTFCRTLTVNEIPISIISAAFGALIFFAILVEKGHYLDDRI